MSGADDNPHTAAELARALADCAADDLVTAACSYARDRSAYRREILLARARDYVAATNDAAAEDVSSCGKCGDEYTGTDCPRCYP